MRSVNPATGELIREYPEHTARELEEIVALTETARRAWGETSMAERADRMRALGRLILERKREYGELVTLEMGKLLRETVPELDKCAAGCAFYADNAADMLAERRIEAGVLDNLAVYQPLGVVLAIMPWNFPFWQALRFAIPAIMGGNGVVLKHASNVSGCALALEQLFRDAGFPENLMRTLLVSGANVAPVIANPLVRGVTLTGSEGAGRAVSAEAGKHLKKVVLELGGSDPFIVFEDADMERCVKAAAMARLIVAGQVCLAAKRYVVLESVAEEFTRRLKVLYEAVRPGDPMDPASGMGPLARADLVDPLEKQVRDSVALGARYVLQGGPMDGPGNFYAPTLLTGVRPGMPVFEEETFGPVGAICLARDEDEALALANGTRYGLGASVWTSDPERARRMAFGLEAGAVAVNAVTKSDPALPFGGIKDSGHGREMGAPGITTFMNLKTIRTTRN